MNLQELVLRAVDYTKKHVRFGGLRIEYPLKVSKNGKTILHCISKIDHILVHFTVVLDNSFLSPNCHPIDKSANVRIDMSIEDKCVLRIARTIFEQIKEIKSHIER